MKSNPRKLLKAIEKALSGIVYLASPQWSTYCNCPDAKNKGHENPTCPLACLLEVRSAVQAIKDEIQVTDDSEIFIATKTRCKPERQTTLFGE